MNKTQWSIILCLLPLLFPFALCATPLTLAEKKHKDYRVHSKTSLKLSYKSKNLYINNLTNNYSIYGGADTQVTLTQNFTYSPRADTILTLATNGTYRTSERAGFNTYEEKEYVTLDNLSMGVSFISPFFEYFSPMLNLRSGSLSNATSYFVASSLGFLMRERLKANISWERHFYQLNPKEVGWRSSSENYSIPTLSLEFIYVFNPLLECSFLTIQKGAGGNKRADDRYLLTFKKIF